MTTPHIKYPMSLFFLSNELNTQISKYLADSPRDLDSFLKISKDYHAVAEANLYDTIRIDHSDEVTMCLLSLSLIRRIELALHMKHFGVPDNSETRTTRLNVCFHQETWKMDMR
jgi:hypothetical protein